MQHGRSREDMEFHAEHDDWGSYYSTKRHGKSFWDRDMSDTEYLQQWYRATKGRATKVFRPSKPRDKK